MELLFFFPTFLRNQAEYKATTQNKDNMRL
jgi:hypothetical protein